MEKGNLKRLPTDRYESIYIASSNDKFIVMENKLVAGRVKDGVRGGVGDGHDYKRVTGEIFVVMEQFHVLIVMVVAQIYTFSKTA